MAQHPGSFEAVREVPAAEAVRGWQDRPSAKMGETAPEPAALHGRAPVAEAPAVTQAEAAPQKPRRLRSLLMVGASLALMSGGGYFGYHYWTVGRFEQSTDDAYVQADDITIAPKVSGYLSDVLVGDNQQVTAGQVLARIDERDFKVALDQAKADVAAAKAAIESKQAALDAQQSAIDSARATVTVDQANQTFAEQENKRYADLATSGYGSLQNAQQAASRIAASRASVQRDSAALASALKQVPLLKADLAQAEATLAHAEAVRGQAELNLGYTSIVSPTGGIVGNRTLRVGQFVQAGTQLMAVVPSAAPYIVANFKETQLTDVHPGQEVEIDVDMFPAHRLHGRVDSLAPASGQTFALLPPDNATGNFTKIVQRIPVKITLDQSAFAGQLRPGMSVTPTIETKEQERTAEARAN